MKVNALQVGQTDVFHLIDGAILLLAADVDDFVFG